MAIRFQDTMTKRNFVSSTIILSSTGNHKYLKFSDYRDLGHEMEDCMMLHDALYAL